MEQFSLTLLLHSVVFVNFGLINTEVFSSSPTVPRKQPIFVDLSKEWVGKSLNESNITFKADAPFTIHSVLAKEGVIGDPYFRYNDKKYRWVSTQDWLITKHFTVASEILNSKRTNLVFQGIDTIGDVYLNKEQIGYNSDKFVPIALNVTKKLRAGKNIISVKLKSPIEYARIQSELFRNAYNYSVLPDCYPEVLHGECHSNFIRKEPCSFGWDFGPSFPTQGLSGSVYLQSVSDTRIKHVLVETVKSQITLGWSLLANVMLESLGYAEAVHVKIAISQTGLQKVVKAALHVGINIVKCAIDTNDVKIEQWWPNGYGKQSLYLLEIKLMNSKLNEIESRSVEFGFRTVELIQDPISASPGLSFFFKINSLPIFLKGSNWIPADALRDRVTNDVIDDYLDSAINANMNVLRVWGGGGYEAEYFYEACDKRGLMIWHDFMFACAMYPADNTFLESVKQEVSYQVARLQHHPSIIIWSANNENEVALRENWYGTSKSFDQYKTDYIKLYVDNVKPLVAKIDVTRPFIVSSPSNGIESEKEGWIAQQPRSPFYGDVHVYDYVRNCWDVDIFPKPRFASEYGYQSYPSIESLINVSLHEDLTWNSTLMFYRQHHQDGNKQIENMIKMNFKLPVNKSSFIYFERMIYMSQIVQALCITFETEHYRRLQGRLEPFSDFGTNEIDGGHLLAAEHHETRTLSHSDAVHGEDQYESSPGSQRQSRFLDYLDDNGDRSRGPTVAQANLKEEKRDTIRFWSILENYVKDQRKSNENFDGNIHSEPDGPFLRRSALRRKFRSVRSTSKLDDDFNFGVKSVKYNKLKERRRIYTKRRSENVAGYHLRKKTVSSGRKYHKITYDDGIPRKFQATTRLNEGNYDITASDKIRLPDLEYNTISNSETHHKSRPFDTWRPQSDPNLQSYGNQGIKSIDETVLNLQGHTMGAMYWQLNDIWQAPSWASIEYGGRWKMLHYFAKGFFSPLALSAYIKNGKVEIFVVSDLLYALQDAILNVSTYKWSSFDILNQKSYKLDIKSQSSQHAARLSVNETCAEVNRCFLIMTVVLPYQRELESARPVYLTPFSQVHLKNPELAVHDPMKLLGDKIVQFTITAKRPAVFVWLTTACKGRFSDNGFLLYQKSRNLSFIASKELDFKEFSKTLKFVSLYDMYN